MSEHPKLPDIVAAMKWLDAFDSCVYSGPEWAAEHARTIKAEIERLRSPAPAEDNANQQTLLPCDVMVAPGTIVRKGCDLGTLMLAISHRKGRPDDETTWQQLPSRIAAPAEGKALEAAHRVRNCDYGMVDEGDARMVAVALISCRSTAPAEDGEGLREALNELPRYSVHVYHVGELESREIETVSLDAVRAALSRGRDGRKP